MNEKTVMTIIVRCIFHRAANPTCDILCLGKEEWRTFLAAEPHQAQQNPFAGSCKGDGVDTLRLSKHC